MQDTRRSYGFLRAPVTLGLAALALAFYGAPSAHAQTAYAATELNRFGTINLTTGKFTQTGTLTATLYGMGVTSDGTLYGVSSDSQLYTVDKATGVETLMGSINPDSPYTATSSGALLYGLTGDASATFFSIAPKTQTVTELNTATGISPDGLLASNGTALYATGISSTLVSNLYKITSSGTVTSVGGTGLESIFSAGVFVGSTLYGFNVDGNIYNLSTVTGVATSPRAYDLGNPDDTGIFAIAAVPAAAPEPSSVAALGLGVLGVGGLILKARRRRRTPVS